MALTQFAGNQPQSQSGLREGKKPSILLGQQPAVALRVIIVHKSCPHPPETQSSQNAQELLTEPITLPPRAQRARTCRVPIALCSSWSAAYLLTCTAHTVCFV